MQKIINVKKYFSNNFVFPSITESNYFSKSYEIKIAAQSMEGCMPLETLLSALALLLVGALSDDEK